MRLFHRLARLLIHPTQDIVLSFLGCIIVTLAERTFHGLIKSKSMKLSPYFFLPLHWIGPRADALLKV